jgi:LPXTG-motif cell wall-anchored protein
VKSKPAKDSSDKFVYWTPQPVYIAILGGDSSVDINNDVVIKIVKTITTLRHRVTKVWEIKSGSEKTAKPSEINVNIRYGGQIIDTVKLTPDNNWTFEWRSEESGDKYKYISGDRTVEFTPTDKNHKWTVDEIFDVKGFKEAYGRGPNEDEKAALEKIANSFTAEIMPDMVENAETDDPVALDQKVTQHRIKNTYKWTTPPPPDTGDENRLAMWAGIMAAAVLLLIVLFVYRRKSSEK